MKYWSLKETIFKDDGNVSIHERPFRNKNEIIKSLKKAGPIYSSDIYTLTKDHEVYLEYGGIKRKFEIFEVNE